MHKIESHKQDCIEVALFGSLTPPYFLVVIFQDEPYHDALVLRRELPTYDTANYEEAVHAFYTAVRCVPKWVA
jgi:hypothetical protein